MILKFVSRYYPFANQGFAEFALGIIVLMLHSIYVWSGLELYTCLFRYKFYIFVLCNGNAFILHIIYKIPFTLFPYTFYNLNSTVITYLLIA